MIKSLLLMFLSVITMSLQADEVANCAPDARFDDLQCSGTVEVKNISELTNYLSNYGLKNNKVKNLNINFAINNAPLYKIQSPCTITFKENLNHNIATNLCIHGKKGIRVKENNYFQTNYNLRMESFEEILIDSHFKLMNPNNVEIISLGNLNGARTRIAEKAEIKADNLLVKSNDRSVIGEYADIEVTNQFSLISNGDNVSDAAVIRENSKIKAESVFIVANTKVRFGNGVVITANKVNLTGDNCSLTNSVTINSENKIGNCFLNSTKSIFSIDKNSGEIPLVVSFSVVDEKVKLAQSFQWSLGNGEVITTTNPSLNYTYQNVGIFTASLKYATTKNNKGSFVYKSGGAIQISAKPRSNFPPVASLQCSTEYMLTNCNGLTSYDPESAPLTYTFNYSDGFSETNTTGLSTHAFLTPGLYNVELVVSDFAGLTSATFLNVEALLPPNINPVAKLNCASNKPQVLSCNGEGSLDSDGTIIQYKYTIDQNKIIIKSTPDAFEESLSSGDHVVSLEIIDNRGGVSTIENTFDVKENLPPSFEISATKTSDVVPFDTVFEIKNVQDTDGQIASINWSFSDNTTASTAMVTKTISEIGTMTGTATVTDDLGKQTVKTISVEGLEPLKTPPVAYFKYFHEGTTFVYLHGIIRKTQFDIKRAYYIIDEGLASQKTVEMTEFYPNTVNTVNVETFGAHTIKQVVEDVRGQVSTFSHTAIVRANLDLVNPYMSFVVNQSNVRQVFVNLNNAFTPDKNGKITNFQINYGNGVIRNIGEETFDTYTYPVAGTYAIKITATTDRGLTSTLQRSVAVTNLSVAVVNPVGAFSYKIFDFAQNVSFYNERSGSPNGGIISYEWNFGDGEVGYGEHVAHFYEPGDYFVTLTVTDFMGLKATQTQHVTILAPGDELATYVKCTTDQNMKADCRFFALDKFNEINYLNVSWGDESEEFLSNPTVEGQGIYDQVHQYSQNGNFNVKLDVGTERGQFKSYIQELSIYTPNTILADIQCYANYMYITCNALGSYDSSGSPLTYMFTYQGKNEISDTGILYFSAKEAGLVTVYVTVKNAKNQAQTVSTQVQALLPPNQPPMANVSCISDAPHTITCKDNSTDSDGSIVVREITFEEGKTFLLTSEGTSYIYSSSGEKNISVRLIDDMGGETIQSYSVTAKENNPPIASFFCNTDRPQRINCTNLSTDNDFNDQVKSLKWEIYRDGELLFSEEGPLNYSIDKLFDFDGVILVKLQVSDLFGGVSEVSEEKVLTKNKNPIASINCIQNQDMTHLCSSNSVDYDGSIVSHQFFVDDQFVGASSSIVYNFMNGGTHIVKYIATDDLGGTAQTSINVMIDKPIASFECSKLNAFKISCSYVKPLEETRRIDSITFKVDANHFYDENSFVHEFDSPGIYKIQLSLVASDGSISNLEKNVEIVGEYLEPLPKFNTFAETGLNVRFDANESLKQGRKVKQYTWEFAPDEIVTSSQDIVNYTFQTPGYYDVKLTCTDFNNVSKSVINRIYVANSEVPHPGDSNNDSLLGIDSDNNNVRDDIQRWITSEAKENLEIKDLLYKYEVAINEEVKNSTESDIVLNQEKIKKKIFNCLLGKVNDDKQVYFYQSVLEYLHTSTEERSKNWSEIQMNLIGQVVEVPPVDQIERLQNCEGI